MPRHATATSFGAKSGNRRGKGPPKGSGGRPTQSFKHFIANLRNDAKAQQALERASQDEDCRNFGTAWKILTEYDEDKPAAKSDITSKGQQVSALLLMPPEKPVE